MLTSLSAIIDALPQLDLRLSPSNESHRVVITSLLFDNNQVDFDDILPPDVFSALVALRDDPAVQSAIERAREFQLNDSAVYYFSALERINSSDWLPDDQDILRSRVKTTGITETTFIIGDLTYRMFDVGGQRSERKKWIHCFENVTTILFLVAISEYDQLLFEDETVNRMQEALTLFDSICNSRWFTKTSIILFLNKIDRFKEKLPVSPMKNYFPDYEGGQDYGAACDYILNRFVS